MSLNKSPKPFFDILEAMPNPYKQRVSSLEHLIDGEPPPNALEDYQLASEFLYTYRGSPDTFTTYRREIEHFLHWAWLVEKKSLQTIRREDIERYIEFTQSPPRAWLGKKNVSRFIERQGERVPNPEWRPYVLHAEGDEAAYTLSQSALQSIFGVLSSFFNFLIQEEYIALNPISQMRQKSKYLRKSQSTKQIRRLSDKQWQALLAGAEQLAEQNPRQHERSLFIIKALFGMYLRISELVETPRWAPKMGDFERDMEGNWWFHTVGKGNKSRQVSISDEMLEALRRYRESRGLSPLPVPGEYSPLIHKTRGRGGIGSTRQIRGIVQTCFNQAIERLKAQGETDEALQMEAATVHWLRHTGISEDVKCRPREHVRDDAGHGSSAITDRYIDVELRERHASGKRKTLKGNSTS